MTSVFISYSRTDKNIADYIGAELRARGAEVFIDYQKLEAGENFIGRIGYEIEKRDVLVLLISPRSVSSRWVQAEVAWAFTKRKGIVPVLLETASLTDFFFLINLEQVDFTRWSIDGKVDDALEKLAKSLGLPAKPIGAKPTPEILVPPKEETTIKPETIIPTFAVGDLSELFLSAAEIADQDPEQAVFLYRRVIEINPNYMHGQANDFVKREEERLKTVRLTRMLPLAKEAMDKGEWSKAEHISKDILALDENHQEAKRIANISSQKIKGEPIYQQAIIAAQTKRWKAFATLLRNLREAYPDYGDPERLLQGEIIQPDLCPLLHELANLTGYASSTWGVAFSPDGTLLASGGRDDTRRDSRNEDGMIKLWDVATQKQLANWIGHGGETYGVAFSPDGKLLASGGGDGMIKLWDVVTQKQLANWTGHGSATYGVAFSPDGALLASGGGDGMIKLWDVVTQKQLANWRGHAYAAFAVTFSLDGKLLASGDGDGVITLWDVATQKQLANWTGHDSTTYGVSFSPDGTLLASGGRDGMIRLWDVATRQHIATLRGNIVVTFGVAFSPDGKILASGGDNGKIKLWGLG